MQKQIQIYLVLLGVFLGSKSLGAFPEKNVSVVMQPKWELLGTKAAKFNLDRDEILVGGNDGLFKSIQIRVKRSGINMHRCVVVYGDGTEQAIELKEEFKAGSESRVIDLEGNKRVIKKIVLWYDTKNYRNKQAIVEVWGRH
ncbi:MAG: DUF2541 family protein [Saprospiraceae bacterium]|nr:DUF2541 family protein [Candidatus Vicinibacter proximus]MCC6843114.1 DUF2541 family protein [Saprospiraceae bacterium]